MSSRFEHVPYASALCNATVEALRARQEMPSGAIAELAADELWLWDEFIGPMLRTIELAFTAQAD